MLVSCFSTLACEYLCTIYLVVIRCQYCEMTLGTEQYRISVIRSVCCVSFLVLFVNCTTVVYVKQIRNKYNKPVLYQ